MSPIPGGPGHPKHKPPKTANSHGGRGGAGGHHHPGHDHDTVTYYQDGTTTYTTPGGVETTTSGHPYHSPPAWVIRRQQILRRAGFGVPVDGVWGSRSQAAWERFQHRIVLNAKIIKAQGEAQIGQHQVARQVRIAQARAGLAIQGAQHSLTVGEIQRHKGGLGPTIDPRAARAARLKAQKKAGRLYANQQLAASLTNIAGGDLKNINNGDVLEQRARAGGIGADDLRLLLDHGYLDPQDEQDVRVLQETVNSHLGKDKVKVTGTYDTQTRDGLIHLFTQAAAAEYRRQLAITKHQMYDTGVAQRVTQKLYGHTIDPAKLLGLLQHGGPAARRLNRELARGFLHYTRDLQLRQDLHDVAVQFGQVSGPFDPFVSTASDRFIIAAFGPGWELAKSKTLPEFLDTAQNIIIRDQQEQQRQAILRANSHPSFWGEAFADANEVLGFSGRLGAHTGAATLEFTYGALNEVIPGTEADLQVLGQGQKHGFVTPYEAWEDAGLHLSTAPPATQLAFQLAFDPVNLVGFGLIENGLRGTALFAGRAVIRAGQGIDTVGHLLSPSLHAELLRAAYRTGDTLIKLENAHPGSALRLFLSEHPTSVWLQAHESYQKAARVVQLATTTRAVAREAVRAAVREAYVVTLRPIAVALETERVSSKLAAAARASEILANSLDPEHLDQIHLEASVGLDALRQAAPDAVEQLLQLKTSLYSDFNRAGAKLSVAGAEIEGVLLEQASRGILERYALLEALAADGTHLNAIFDRHLESLNLHDLRTIASSVFSKARLSTIREGLGTYRAGHVPLKWMDAYDREVALAAERIQKQVLPALDEMLRQQWGDALWLQDAATGAIRLADEAGARTALDQFFGYDVKDAYNPRNYVPIDNPNAGLRVNKRDAEALQDREIARRSNSITAYAERRKRLAADTDATEIDHWALRKIKAIQDEVHAAWHFDPSDEKYFDVREKIRVPVPQARHIEYANTPQAKQQLDALARATADAGRAHLPDEKLVVDGAEQQIIEMAVQPDAWRDYAGSVARLEALHVAADQGMLSKAYFQNGLILSGLREHQARPYRMLYHALNFGLWTWKTLTLPLRPAFAVRNFADNLFKSLVAGLRDPRLLFNAEGKSVFEIGLIREFRGVIRFFDTMFQTDVRSIFDHILGQFWSLHPSTVEKIFNVHGIPIAPEVIDGIRTSRSAIEDIRLIEQAPSVSEANKGGTVAGALRRTKVDRVPKWYRDFEENAWDLMAARPENQARKALYISRYRQALSAGKTEPEAMRIAWERVSQTLFDYDSVTVIEENLKVFLPFIFFWRSNTQFWAREVVDKPWFFVGADKLLDAHEDGNADMPEWMRRYVSLAPVASITDLNPALSWMSPWLRDGSNFDPLNYISIVQFYRAFKGDSFLPADKQGWAFIAPLVDGLNSLGGLGVNPFWSEVGQRLGILNRHSWRDIFPQTTLIQSITDTDFVRKHLGVDSPNGFNVEDWLLDPIFKKLASGEPSGAELTRANFDAYVNQEMAEQANRGETPSRAAAEQKIRGFVVFQTVVGYAIGVFPRRISKDARAIYDIIALRAAVLGDPSKTPAERQAELTAQWFGMTPDQQTAYRLFAKRGYSPAAFDRYAMGLAGAQAFFAIDDYDEQQKYLHDHPEIAPIVYPVNEDGLPSAQYLQDQMLLSRSDAVIRFGSVFLGGIGADSDVRQDAYDLLVTRGLRDFWAKNDTPQEVRDRHIRGQYFRYVTKVQNTYFQIPGTDYAAKDAYLAAHPELKDWWRINDGAADDYKGIQQQINGTFREVYFHYVDQGDWDTAGEFLRLHPFIFDFTSAEGRVNADGSWQSKSEVQADYSRVAAQLRVYYSLSEQDRAAYAKTNPLVTWFINKYAGKGTELLAGQSSYTPGGLTEHARDYLKVKPELDAFFALPDSQREAYLANHPLLKAYFAKYARDHTTSRGFGKLDISSALAANPEIAARYNFWVTLLKLRPDKRAEFIHRHAEQAGIFIYGSLGYDQQQKQVAAWHRQALRFGDSDRAFWYRKIAPLMDLYFSLKPGSAEASLFLSVNPELGYYFDHFAKHKTAIPAKIEPLVKHYFLLPAFGSARGDYLDEHPELRVYFNRDATPAEAAMQRQIDAYFALPFGPRRDAYLARHPEVGAYFDQRTKEHDLFGSLAAAFNASDPRMAEFRAMYDDIIPLDRIHLWELRRHGKHQIVEDDKQPAAPTVTTRRDRTIA